MADYSTSIVFAVCAVTLLNFGEANKGKWCDHRERNTSQNETEYTADQLRSLAEVILQGNAVPFNLVNIGGVQYFLGDSPVLNFPQAAEMCNLLGRMKLVELDSSVKMQALAGHLLNNGFGHHVWWTSGTKVVDTWIWSSSGQVFRSSPGWYGNNPNEGRTESVCAYLVGNQRGIGDTLCRYPDPWICEVP